MPQDVQPYGQRRPRAVRHRRRHARHPTALHLQQPPQPLLRAGRSSLQRVQTRQLLLLPLPMQPRAAARERAPQQARQPQLQPHLSQGSVPLHWLWLWPWRPWRVLLMLGALVAMPMFVVLTLLSLLFVLLMLLLLRPLAQAPQLLPQALLRLLQLHQQFVVDLIYVLVVLVHLSSHFSSCSTPARIAVLCSCVPYNGQQRAPLAQQAVQQLQEAAAGRLHGTCAQEAVQAGADGALPVAAQCCR